MENLRDQPYVPPSAFIALRERADGAGLSVDRMAGELGLDLNGSAVTGRVPLAQFLRLQTRLTTLLDDETGRLSKRPLLTGSTELALSRLPSRGSLTDAMETVARSYNLLHGGPYNRVEERVDAVGLFTDDSSFPYAVDDQEEILFAMETTLLFAHALLRLIVPSVAAGGWRGVELKRNLPPARVPFEKHVPTAYQQRRYGLLYDRGSAKRVLNFAPPGAITLEAVTEEQIRLLQGGPDDRTFAGRVKLLIEEGAGDQTAVADALGMSVATLRRRLVEEDASFRALRIETLREQAEVLLKTEAPLVHVAERLGFSDVRSFSRAFKTWTGMTPNAMRRSARL
ncbi:MAG: helix-turn-helix transcriptional regulator [Pseudomonadota bacterium]